MTLVYKKYNHCLPCRNALLLRFRITLVLTRKLFNIFCVHLLTESLTILLIVDAIYTRFSPLTPFTHEINSLAYQKRTKIPGRK